MRSTFCTAETALCTTPAVQVPTLQYKLSLVTFQPARQSYLLEQIIELYVAKVDNCSMPGISFPALTCLRYSVVVSTPDFESGNPGSNPGTAMKHPFCVCVRALACSGLGDLSVCIVHGGFAVSEPLSAIHLTVLWCSSLLDAAHMKPLLSCRCTFWKLRQNCFGRQHSVFEHSTINVAHSDRKLPVSSHVNLPSDVRVAAQHIDRGIRTLCLQNTCK